MELEKQMDRVVTAIDQMDKAMVEMKGDVKRDMGEIKADLRDLKEKRIREFDMFTVGTNSRLNTIENKQKELDEEVKWMRRGVVVALLTAVGSLVGLALKH